MQKRNLKAFALTLLASSISMATYATTAGFYMGIMAGPAQNNAVNVNASVLNSGTTTQVKPRSKQFGTRLFLGYQMNDYSAFDFGFTFFTNISYSQAFPNIPLCSSPSIGVRSVELLGKGILPFYYFDIFFKAGLAAVYLNESASLNPFNPVTHPTQHAANPCGKSKSTINYDPVFALGASYNITPNWVADLTWSTYLVGGKVEKMNWVALGISYHFVDLYCGQFLC